MAKYNNVKVQLTGNDGNAFAVIGACASEAKKQGVSNEEIELFKSEAMSGDYNNLLSTCMDWFDVS